MSKRIFVMLAAAVSLATAGSVKAQSVTEIKRPVTTKSVERSRPQNVQTWQGSQIMPSGQNRQNRQGRPKRMMVMTGDVAKENIQKVTSEIRWNTNLNSALAQAHRQNKMVLWVHMIGNISGAT